MEKDPRAVFGEYDPPLPPVNPNPSREDREKFQRLIEKYEKLAAERIKREAQSR